MTETQPRQYGNATEFTGRDYTDTQPPDRAGPPLLPAAANTLHHPLHRPLPRRRAAPQAPLSSPSGSAGPWGAARRSPLHLPPPPFSPPPRPAAPPYLAHRPTAAGLLAHAPRGRH